MPDLFDYAEGQRLKETSTELVIGNAHEAWRDAVWQTLLALSAIDGGAFTNDDLRQSAADRGIGEPHHPNCWGAMMRKAAKSGLIERCGYEKSQIPAAHARVIAVWRQKESPRD